MLISDTYRQLQAALHASDAFYGSASVVYAPMVANLMNRHAITELLDYGAGKRRLVETIGTGRLVDHEFCYYAYEPSDESCADSPEPREMVACIDVLEHIEPDCLENVLDDLQRVTLSMGFFTVAMRAAHRRLPDGRNAHLIQMPASWWLPKFMERFDLQTFQKIPDGFMVLVTPRDKPFLANAPTAAPGIRSAAPDMH